MVLVGRALVAALTGVVIAAVATPGPIGAGAAQGPWSAAADMVQPHQAATATVLRTGRVLVVGSFSRLDTGAELYDPTANSWSPTATMLVPRALATATLLPSGKVLIAGGIAADTGHSTARTELYDPIANAWSPGAEMAVARSSHAATLLLNGKVLVAGGQNPAGYIATAELYDPANDRWSMAGRMDAGYAGPHVALLQNGRVLLAGGETFGDGRAELYDPSTNGWSNAGTAGRVAQTATRLTDGRVLVTGLGGEADLYDPATNQWSAAARMLGDRDSPSASLLADGRVLVAGGTTTSVGRQLWLSSAELYDPTSNRWSPAGCMGQARWEHTSTVLPAKKVLIAGGDLPGVSLASTELFDPSEPLTGQSIENCPTAPATAPATSPAPDSASAPSAVPEVASSSFTNPVIVPTEKPVALTATTRPASFQPPTAMIGLLGAAILVLLAPTVYLWSRRRRRGI